MKKVEGAVQPPDTTAQDAARAALSETAQDAHQAALTGYNTKRDRNMNVSLNGLTPPNKVERAGSKDEPQKE